MTEQNRTLYIGSDHAGFVMKEALENFLKQNGYRVIDCGDEVFLQEDDYPDFAVAVARSVANDAGSRGIVVCGSGAGVCIAANKVSGIRAAVAWDETSAFVARNDDDTNVLCFGARMTDIEDAKKIVLGWLCAEFQNEERFARRIEKILRYEEEERKCSESKCARFGIVPAILEEDFEEALKKMERLRSVAHSVQIDVLDDTFAKGRTFPLERLAERRYPFFLEAHLMVSDPASHIETCARAGIESVAFHRKAMRDETQVIELCDHIVRRGMRAIVALDAETEEADMAKLASHIDGVLVLGVVPGKSGQEMLPDTMLRIQSLRKALPPRVPVGVDGGVTKENITQCVQFGADRIVTSSALFQSENPKETLKELQALFIREKQKKDA